MIETNPRADFLQRLFERLWLTYRHRVMWADQAVTLLTANGAPFVNDHMAFRTLAGQSPYSGIARLSRLFEALGYVPACGYHFPQQSLSAIHFEHPVPGLPKLFISECQTWRLPREVRLQLETTLANQLDSLDLDALAELSAITPERFDQWLPVVQAEIEERPWPVPDRQVVEQVNAVSQYAAWVLVHGNNVNHFTALIDANVPGSLGDLEQTAAALQAAGIPMKAELEGARGSKLRQTATAAVTVDVPVINQGQPTTMPWSYAYFELAERGTIADPETGRPVRFEGFLGPQATQLFEMTRRS
jgi:hypothetical protein